MPAHPASTITHPATTPAFRTMLSIAISCWLDFFIYAKAISAATRDLHFNLVPSILRDRDQTFAKYQMLPSG
ncbi:hypothetical protein [Noviherbaspirillum sp. Root189]|uniref:hypothetical protein n=1 Tax=Noviherbaspirillum sp. Root189 TaxID=1736487 RepID=UPI00138F723D|nr:hypothetical protein [Noviherbaspirillum sp. Root189]